MNNCLVYKPEYYNKFKCIGPACEDSCCIGWQINVDRPTNRLLRNTTNSTIRDIYNEYSFRDKTAKNTPLEFGLYLNEQYRCPFLNEQNLCRIQLELGEPSLPLTCHSYPRSGSFGNNKLYLDLTLSCPEATRLVVGLDGPANYLCEEYNPDDRVIIDYSIEEAIAAHNSLDIDSYEVLRPLLRSIIYNDSTLDDKLALIGLFASELSNCIISRGDIPKTVHNFTKEFSSNILSNAFSDIPPKPFFKLSTLIKLLEDRLVDVDLEYRLIDCYKAFRVGIGLTGSIDSLDSIDDIHIKNYTHAYNNFYKPYINSKPYVISNVLSSITNTSFFPFAPLTSLMDNYALLVIQLSTIEMLLVGMSGFYRSDFSDEHVVELISSYTKKIYHNKNYLYDCLEILGQAGYSSLPYLIMLSKN